MTKAELDSLISRLNAAEAVCLLVGSMGKARGDGLLDRQWQLWRRLKAEDISGVSKWPDGPEDPKVAP